jgi:hypothetical protein
LKKKNKGKPVCKDHLYVVHILGIGPNHLINKIFYHKLSKTFNSILFFGVLINKWRGVVYGPGGAGGAYFTENIHNTGGASVTNSNTPSLITDLKNVITVVSRLLIN